MNFKKINSNFNDLNNIAKGEYVFHETDYEKKQRRVMLDNSLKSYNAFISNNVYEVMDDERLMETPSLDFDEPLNSGDVIERMTDVIKVFYDLQSKLLSSSSKICNSGAQYFNVIQKKFNIIHNKMDKKTEGEIVKQYREALLKKINHQAELALMLYVHEQ